MRYKHCVDGDLFEKLILKKQFSRPISNCIDKRIDFLQHEC